jgi:hypothetical protein
MVDKKSNKRSKVELLSGYPEGTVLETGEIIRASLNEKGVVVGWHKEAPKKKGAK